MRRILRTFPTSRQRRKADRVGQRMGVEYMARQIYQDVISRVTRTEADWKAVCRLAGQIYRYEFDNVLMVYAQNPSATLVADYDTWKKECKADMEPGGGGENLSDLLSALWKRGEVSEAPETDRKSQMKQLKAFTKREVRYSKRGLRQEVCRGRHACRT